MCPYLEKVIKDSEMGDIILNLPLRKMPWRRTPARDGQASRDDAELSQSVDMK